MNVHRVRSGACTPRGGQHPTYVLGRHLWGRLRPAGCHARPRHQLVLLIQGTRLLRVDHHLVSTVYHRQRAFYSFHFQPCLWRWWWWCWCWWGEVGCGEVQVPGRHVTQDVLQASGVLVCHSGQQCRHVRDRKYWAGAGGSRDWWCGVHLWLCQLRP